MYFAQGFKSLSSLSITFYLKDRLLLEPAVIQSVMSVATLPWSSKPLYGPCSDAFPIRGQHRKPYLVVASLIGVAAWFALTLLASTPVQPQVCGSS